MSIIQWRCLARVLLALSGIAFASLLMAQDYPIKPVRIVTSPAGGGNDFPARVVARGLAGPLGQQVIVDNRATVLIGEIVAKAPPDGYTLLVSGSPHWIGPLIEKASYDPIADFAPISMLDRAPVLLVVHPSMPVTSVRALVRLAKAKPGELNYSSGGAGGSNHLGAILFNHMAGVNIVRVPYKGSGPAMTAVMSGEVHLMFPGIGAAAPHVKSRRLRALAVGSAKPSPFLPGIPTIAASGVPGYESDAKHALFAPAGTPAAIIARLHREVVRLFETQQARDIFFRGGVEAATCSPEELTAIMKSERETIGKILRAAGISRP